MVSCKSTPCPLSCLPTKNVQTNHPNSSSSRATASAGVRLHAGIQLAQTEDRTHAIAPIALWCMAEMTCAYAIYCLPIAPKVFGPKGAVGRIAVRAGLMSSAPASKSASQGYANKSATSTRNKYFKVDDSVQLQSLPTSRSKQDETASTEGILRTTKIEATREPAPLGTPAGQDSRW